MSLSLPTAAFVTRGALIEQGDLQRKDLASLLVSSCEASVVFDDRETLQATLDELAPRLRQVASVRVLRRDGTLMGSWAAPGAVRASATHRRAVHDMHGVELASVEVTTTTDRVDETLNTLWIYLGLIGLLAIAVSLGTSFLVGREMEEKSRLEGELNVAQRIQLGILPKRIVLPGLEAAALMVTASEVGGDYYDAIPTANGGWICFGDVVGHGLPAGVVMLMMQSGLGTMLRCAPDTDPRSAFIALNDLLFDNVHHRLGDDKYASLVLIKYDASGRLHFAGGHLDFVLYRAGRGEAEFVPTPGPFVALEAELEQDAIEHHEIQLESGDLLLVYSDGITESRNERGEMFGPERLRQLVVAQHRSSMSDLTQTVVRRAREWGPKQLDDMTVVALRYEPSRPA